MDIVERINRCWRLGPILELRELPGSGACFLVTTDGGQFVYKQVDRSDFVAVYTRIAAVLNQNGVIQPKVVPTADGTLTSHDGFCILEYVPGDAPTEFTRARFLSAVSFLRRYNEILRLAPFDPSEIEVRNVWDEVRSTEGLCRHALAFAQEPLLDEADRALFRQGVDAIRSRRQLLDGLPKQLVHSDVGPGNLIFEGENAKTIIDFTPDYENELPFTGL